MELQLADGEEEDLSFLIFSRAQRSGADFFSSFLLSPSCREYLRTSVIRLAQDNPHTEIVVRSAPGRKVPIISAFYSELLLPPTALPSPFDLHLEPVRLCALSNRPDRLLTISSYHSQRKLEVHEFLAASSRYHRRPGTFASSFPSFLLRRFHHHPRPSRLDQTRRTIHNPSIYLVSSLHEVSTKFLVAHDKLTFPLASSFAFPGHQVLGRVGREDQASEANAHRSWSSFGIG